MTCPTCAREVLLYGISHFPGADAVAAKFRESAERDGKLVLFNPPPFGPQRCPRCRTELVERPPD